MHCQPAALREVRPECISEGGRKSAPLGPPPVGNPLSPKKRILRQGSPQSARAGHRFFKNVKPAFLGKVPVKSHLLRADKTLFEPMPAVRERLAQPATRRQKNRVGTGWKCTRLATPTFLSASTSNSGSRACRGEPWPASPERAARRRRAPFKINLPRPGAG